MSITDGMILPDIEKVSNGQIRFNMVETAPGIAAYTYYPGPSVGGDVFLGLDIGTDSETGNVQPYWIGRSDIVHELGHALGLIHPFEGESVLPANEDHSANSVMSYTDYRLRVPQFTGTQAGSGSEVGVSHVGGPRTISCPMISLLSRCSFYTTTWDAGGDDILDFSGTGSYNVIDLTPGSHNHINYRDIDTQIAEQQAVYQDQFGTNYYDGWVAAMICSIWARADLTRLWGAAAMT